MKTNTITALLTALVLLAIALPAAAQAPPLPQDRSVNQGGPTVTPQIVNQSGEQLAVYWIDENGKAIHLGPLPPNPAPLPMPTSPPGYLYRVMKGNQVYATFRVTGQNPQTFLVKRLANNTQPQPSPNIPAGHTQLIRNTLGRGYDAVKAAYLDPTMLKNRIFDIQPSDYNYVQAGGSARSKDDYHRSTTEYSKYLGGGVSVGLDYGLFSGEMEMNASTSSSGSTDRSYYNLFEVRTFFVGTLHMRNQAFATGQSPAPTARVNANALQQLNTLQPNDVIRNYGTHYLSSLGYGGTALFTRSETASRHSTREQMELKVKASYGAVNGSANVNSSSSNTDTSENAKTTFRVVGGNAGSAINNLNIQDQMGSAKGAYTQWANSTRTTPGLSEFLRDGLLPIWTVPGLRPDRAHALKAAVAAYAKKDSAPQFDSKPRRVLPADTNVTLQQFDTGTGKTTDDFIGVPASDPDYPLLGRAPATLNMIEGAGSFYAWAYGLSLAEIDRQKASKFTGPFASMGAQPAESIKALSELNNGDTIRIRHNSRDLYVGAGSDSAYWTAPGNGAQYEWKIWIKGVPGNKKQAVMEGDLVSIASVGYPGMFLQRDNGNYMDAIDSAEEQSQGAANGKLRYFKISEVK